jgi:hypothetical protein
MKQRSKKPSEAVEMLSGRFGVGDSLGLGVSRSGSGIGQPLITSLHRFLLPSHVIGLDCDFLAFVLHDCDYRA